MQKTIAATDLRQCIDTVLEEVNSHQTSYVLTTDDRPQAVVVPYEAFRHFQAFQESELRHRWDSLLGRMAERNARFSEREVAEDVAAEMHRSAE